MATPAAILGILVKANTAQANLALAETDAQLDATAASAERATAAASTTGAALRKMGTVAKWAALGGVALFVVEAKKAVATTQELTKATQGLHNNLGIANKRASEWAAVARARGVDTNKLTMSMRSLSNQVEAAKAGSQSSIDLFKAMGISMEDVRKGSTDVQGLMFQLADGMDKAGAGTERVSAASKLFGRSWSAIAPLLRDGSSVMRDQLDAAKQYGATLSGPTLRAQEDLRTATIQSKLAWEGMQVTLASAVTPALTAANEQFQKIATIMASDKLTDDQKFKQIAAIIDKDFQKALDVALKLIPEFANKVGETAPKIAEALVQGFLNADVWGKLALGAWFFTKIGLTGTALKAAGARLGGIFGLSFAAGAAPGEAAAAGGGSLSAARGIGLTSAGGPFAAGAAAARGPGAGPLLIGGGLIAAGGVNVAKNTDSILEKLGSTVAAGGPLSLGLHGISQLVGNDLPKNLAELANPVKQVETAFGAVTHPIRSASDALHAAEHPISAVTSAWGSLTGAVDKPDFTDRIKELTDKFGTLGQAALSMSGKQKQAFFDAAVAAHKNGEITDATMKRVRKSYDVTVLQVGQDLLKMRVKSYDSVSGIQKDLDSVLGKIENRWKGHGEKVDRLTNRAYDSAKNAIHDAVAAGVLSVDQGTKAIEDLLIQQARTFGIAPSAIRHPISSSARTDMARQRKQRGGMIGGTGSGDIVPAMLEPGEFVMNREATRSLGPLLEAMNKGVSRFQKGGAVDFGGHPSNVSSGVRNLIALMQAHFPLAVSSTTDLTHAAGSYHYKGEAVDLSAAPQVMFAASEWVKRSGTYKSLVEGIHNPNLSVSQGNLVSPSFWGASTWGAHTDHIHMAILGALAKHAAALKQLHFTAGAPAYRADAAGLNSLSGAATKRLQQQIQASMAVGPEMGGGGALSKSQLVSLWNATGKSGDANLMAAIALAESGGNPGVTNSIGARGLWQIIPSTANLYGLNYGNLTDPRANALGAHKILAGQGLGAWDTYTGGQYAQYLQHGGLVEKIQALAKRTRHFEPSGHHQRKRAAHMAAHLAELETLLGLRRESGQLRSLRSGIGAAQSAVFAGSFANGGIVPGPIGAPRIVEAHGGERITPPGSATVEINFASGMEWLERFIEVKVDGQTRKKARAADRRLPGRPGVLR